MARPADHPDNRLLSTLANHERWAAVDDRTAATAPARQAFRDRFVQEARERFGDLPADELARRAESLRKAHYPRLARASARSVASGRQPSAPSTCRTAAVRVPPDTRDGPGVITPQPAPNAKTPATRSKPIVPPGGDVPAQIRRRREAFLRPPPMADGQRDPVDPDTRFRCVECKRDVRLRPYVRLTSQTIACRRCYRDRWAPR
jgi:hypothetical protein